MSLINIVLAIITIISSIITIITYISHKIKKEKEKANVEIIQERVASLYNTLELIFNPIHDLIQLPKKNPETTTQDMQTIARMIRKQMYLLSKHIKITQGTLQNWEFGTLIQSEEIKLNLQEKNATNENHE